MLCINNLCSRYDINTLLRVFFTRGVMKASHSSQKTPLIESFFNKGGDLQMFLEFVMLLHLRMYKYFPPVSHVKHIQNSARYLRWRTLLRAHG